MWVRHGMEGTRLYKIWDCMKQRCTNQNSPNFENYGGRGITVCKEWEDFVNFLSWAEKSGYKDTLSLDRETMMAHILQIIADGLPELNSKEIKELIIFLHTMEKQERLQSGEK